MEIAVENVEIQQLRTDAMNAARSHHLLADTRYAALRVRPFERKQAMKAMKAISAMNTKHGRLSETRVYRAVAGTVGLQSKQVKYVAEAMLAAGLGGFH